MHLCFCSELDPVRRIGGFIAAPACRQAGLQRLCVALRAGRSLIYEILHSTQNDHAGIVIELVDYYSDMSDPMYV